MTPSRKILFTGKMPWFLRAVAALLIPINLTAAVPMNIVMAAISPAPLASVLPDGRTPSPSVDQGLLQPPSSAFAEQAPPVAPNPPAIPQFSPPSPNLTFSAAPTDAELITAHCFDVPLAPQTGNPQPNENTDLAQALTAFRSNFQDLSPLTTFLSQHPTSRWNASLLTNLGLIYQSQGRWSKALSSFEQAWSLGKDGTTALQKAVADRTLGELAQAYAHLGNTQQLGALLDETKSRDVRGAATRPYTLARCAYERMTKDPTEAFHCGPFAVGQIFHLLRPGQPVPKDFHACKSTPQGTNLATLETLAQTAGLNYQVAFRTSETAVPTPCVVHWKVGHFSVLIKKMGDNYLACDPGLGADTILTAAALDEEASGYFLVPSGALPAGWRAVDTAEAETIFGKGSTNGPPPPPPPNDPGCGGMTIYQLEKDSITLALFDNPVGYNPPVGPAVRFTANYNSAQPADTTNLSNLGNKWSFNWLCYIKATSTADNATVSYGPGGGESFYTGFNPTTGSFAQQQVSNDTLTLNSNGTYTLSHPNGGQEIFGLIKPGTTPTVFRTKTIDPQGNVITYGYDSNYRLVTVTDAINPNPTVLSYGSTDSTNPAFYNITKVTDPFGRFATFGYVAGQLTSITDVLGITSSYNYGTGDFVNSLTTPYGKTLFASSYSATDCWVQVTDPQGGQERAEWVEGDSGYTGVDGSGGSDPANVTPSWASDPYLEYRNTFFWDKQAMATAPGDYTKAELIHWLHATASNYNLQANVIECIKEPFENRVWYAYPNQNNGTFVCGTGSQPSEIGRILDDGTEQDYKYSYDALGNKTQSIDPLGRETDYTYDTNGIDLLKTTQKNGSGSDLLSSSTYNLQHLPLTTTDASGQTTKYTYNSAGQVSTITDAKNEVAKFYYDPAGAANTTDLTKKGYLVTVVGPVAGANTLYTYDGFGRLHTVTDSEGYTVATTYDVFDRPINVTYPDGTFTQTLYNRLDAEWTRDRLGRWTHLLHDALRHLVVQEDPLLRKTSYDWCNCGALEAITDPAGNTTTWMRDAQSRVTNKFYPDGTSLNYTYETTTSRLKSVTDAKLQVTNYTYYADNTLNQVSYTNAVNPTPTVSFFYDPVYPRLLKMTDGIGTTNYAYNPVPSAPITTPVTGANQLRSISGPLAKAIVSYKYDELGRMTDSSVGAALDDPANTSHVGYDALGRVTTATNPLGNFTYGYVNQTARLDHVIYPNNQRTNYGYYPNSAATPGNDDQRLAQIQNLSTTSSNLSTFNYTYNAVGMITSWSKQLDTASALTSSFGYDAADQLTSASVPSVSSVVQNYSYQYDVAGNRLSEQIDSSVTTSAFNSLNQLTGQTPGGLMQFSGTVNEPVTATVGGNPATVVAAGNDSSGHPVYNWQGSASVTAVPSQQPNKIPLVGTDTNGKKVQSTISVTVSGGAARIPKYDLNGNLTDDGAGKTYGYDAANRMVKITQASGVTGFAYDGMGRRVQETLNGTLIKQWVWCSGAQPCEERDASNNVTKRFYGIGEQIGGANYFFTHDHLGSVREMTNSAGSLAARYDYDPFGRRTLVSGTDRADLSFTGFYYDQASGLDLTLTRAYDANLGRWLSRDTLPDAELSQGPNLYSYVGNNPISRVDPDGMGIVDCNQALAELAAATGRLAARLADVALDSQGTGLDLGHRKAIQEAMNQVQKALNKVNAHCGCAVGYAAAVAAALAVLAAAATVLA